MNTSNRNLCVCATTMHISLCADYLQKKANPAFSVECYSLVVEIGGDFFCVAGFRRPPNRQLICSFICWGNYFRPVNKDMTIHCKYCLLIEKTWGWADEDALTRIFSLLIFHSTITKKDNTNLMVQVIMDRVHSGNDMLVVFGKYEHRMGLRFSGYQLNFWIFSFRLFTEELTAKVSK